MSRTLHTEPRSRLAARRLARPLASRADDASARLATATRAHAERVAAASTIATPAAIRITCTAPRPGFVHPASRADVRLVLAAAGAQAAYGLRSIELCRAVRAGGSQPLRLGRLLVPGRIRLYEQPCSPWRLRGRLNPQVVDRLVAAGARVEHDAAIDAVEIAWPGDSLRRFMLLDVLLHEIGHHVLQHRKGKRLATIARTRDHEAFAERHARQLRARCLAALDRA